MDINRNLIIIWLPRWRHNALSISHLLAARPSSHVVAYVKGTDAFDFVDLAPGARIATTRKMLMDRIGGNAMDRYDTVQVITDSHGTVRQLLELVFPTHDRLSVLVPCSRSPLAALDRLMRTPPAPRRRRVRHIAGKAAVR